MEGTPLGSQLDRDDDNDEKEANRRDPQLPKSLLEQWLQRPPEESAKAERNKATDDEDEDEYSLAKLLKANKEPEETSEADEPAEEAPLHIGETAIPPIERVDEVVSEADPGIIAAPEELPSEAVSATAPETVPEPGVVENVVATDTSDNREVFEARPVDVANEEGPEPEDAPEESGESPAGPEMPEAAIHPAATPDPESVQQIMQRQQQAAQQNFVNNNNGGGGNNGNGNNYANPIGNVGGGGAGRGINAVGNNFGGGGNIVGNFAPNPGANTHTEVIRERRRPIGGLLAVDLLNYIVAKRRDNKNMKINKGEQADIRKGQEQLKADLTIDHLELKKQQDALKEQFNLANTAERHRNGNKDKEIIYNRKTIERTNQAKILEQNIEAQRLEQLRRLDKLPETFEQKTVPSFENTLEQVARAEHRGIENEFTFESRHEVKDGPGDQYQRGGGQSVQQDLDPEYVRQQRMQQFNSTQTPLLPPNADDQAVYKQAAVTGFWGALVGIVLFIIIYILTN